jgi:hypothetical protein
VSSHQLTSRTDLAKFLFINREFGLLLDVLRMMMASDPANAAPARLLVKTLLSNKDPATALAEGRKWIARQGSDGIILSHKARCHAVCGPDVAADFARMLILLDPGELDRYQVLSALLDTSAGQEALVLGLLRWLMCGPGDRSYFEILLLHKAAQLGLKLFEDHADRLVRSRPNALWARYYRTLLRTFSGQLSGQLAGYQAPDAKDLVVKP